MHSFLLMRARCQSLVPGKKAPFTYARDPRHDRAIILASAKMRESFSISCNRAGIVAWLSFHVFLYLLPRLSPDSPVSGSLGPFPYFYKRNVPEVSISTRGNFSEWFALYNSINSAWKTFRNYPAVIWIFIRFACFAFRRSRIMKRGGVKNIIMSNENAASAKVALFRVKMGDMGGCGGDGKMSGARWIRTRRFACLRFHFGSLGDTFKPRSMIIVDITAKWILDELIRFAA